MSKKTNQKMNNTYTVKELFGEDLPTKYVLFLNKCLKRLMDLKKQNLLPKVYVNNETWPSNQWPKWTAEYACAALVGVAHLDMTNAGAMETYIDYPCKKGWCGTYDDGEWLDYADELGIKHYDNGNGLVKAIKRITQKAKKFYKIMNGNVDYEKEIPE